VRLLGIEIPRYYTVFRYYPPNYSLLVYQHT